MKKDQVIEISQEEALEAVEALAGEQVHCFIMMFHEIWDYIWRFIGADWGKESVISLIKDSKRIAWADNPFNHNLAIINNGKLYNFDLRYGDYIRWLSTPKDGVDTKDLEEEVKELRGQYLETEEKLKELGKTTKRVQTFVSKLKDNK